LHQPSGHPVLVDEVLQRARGFSDKAAARQCFTALGSALRTQNGLAPGSPERAAQAVQVRALAGA
jgi:hypothetical protein